uniref:maturase K n=1 Tax=Pellia neesiana TaxID=70144 RepID=UPI00257C07A7|nr:maturase K [Pellia neesiana]WIA68586.1 maturase K [Pellia neesiana]WIA68672.1 maturase K [Pellia neesiana]WIA68758.1 maturase K [Pellia neesiana]
MVTISKVSSTIRKFKKIKRNSCWQQRFLYPFLFQDDIYGIACNRFMNESNHRKKKFIGLNNEFNFLILKRLVKKLRQSKNLWIVSDGSTKESRAIREIIIIIFNIIILIQSEQPLGRIEWNSYQSIHSVFPFMEDRVRNLNNCLNITIPYIFHPENLIRIVRRRISDISFLHFLRLLLHRGDNSNVSNTQTSTYSRKNRFHCFLWNFYIHEFEYSLIHVWRNIYEFQSTPLWFFTNRTNFVQKIGSILEQSDTVEDIAGRNYSIHYVRYKNNLIIIVNDSMKLFIVNWKNSFIILWQKYFHSWFEPHRISVGNLYRNNQLFLGYILRIRSRFLITQIQLVNHSIDTNLIIREFCGNIPIVSLIGLLARENFCDIMGRPTCRLSWTTLADKEIFERFDQITRNISRYYGGCLERKGLYQFQYILRFSCAKTLACKHKGTIRTVWKRYGSNFVANSISWEEFDLSKSWQINLHGKKFWYFGIIQINYLVNLSRKLKNVRNS